MPHVRAWTWLVLALALVAALAAVSLRLPWSMRSIRDYKAPAEMAEIILAIKTYQTEYNHLPTELEHPAEDQRWQRTRGELLQALLGKNDPLNPKKIAFIDPQPGNKIKKTGFYCNEQNEPAFADPWGEPYYVIMDLSGEGKVPNPDPRDNQKHPFIEGSVIMFSAGPDHDPNTWGDNVLSWKPESP
jgi:hypothetical protein